MSADEHYPVAIALLVLTFLFVAFRDCKHIDGACRSHDAGERRSEPHARERLCGRDLRLQRRDIDVLFALAKIRSPRDP